MGEKETEKEYYGLPKGFLPDSVGFLNLDFELGLPTYLMRMASDAGSDAADPKKLKKKRKYRQRQLKVNVRKYTVRNEFDRPKDFEDWVSSESKKAPWYLCSSYKAGGVLKRIYACSYRKRAGFKKCERQLMVLFYPQGKVTVLDSCSEKEHVHYPIDTADESRYRTLRTVIALRSQAEFSSWMTKQRERFAWHRRAGRRSFANIDYYQCASVGSDGTMCKRVMHVEYTPENGVIIRELESLPPHELAPAHRKPLPGTEPVKRRRRAKRANSDSEYLPSTSKVKATGRMRRSLFDDGVKQEPEEDEDELLDGKETSADGGTARSAAHSIEDFVIIPDDDYESDNPGSHPSPSARGIQVKRELLETLNGARRGRSDILLTSEIAEPNGSAERHVDRSGCSGQRTWTNGLQTSSNIAKAPPNSQCNNSLLEDDDPKYNLENFAEELAKKLSKTPLERMAELRENVRREMDEVFAQQIVKEIVSRSYSTEARREVLDRIREVLRPP